MRLKTFLSFTVFCLLLLPGRIALAWGEEGHRIIGKEALELLDPSAGQSVADILDRHSESTVGEACNWPDRVRDSAEWEWSAPLHYVNIPRKAVHYDRQRDCSDGLCVSEGIKRYANELTRTDLDDVRRWQAFAWLCHLVGDLHQPLHAGYQDDRGANLLLIEYRGETHNLHEFWDHVVIEEQIGKGGDRVLARDELAGTDEAAPWNPDEVNDWTDESHRLVAASAYPPGRVITPEFAGQTWQITLQQWRKASARLARILNATLGEGETEVD